MAVAITLITPERLVYAIQTQNWEAVQIISEALVLLSAYTGPLMFAKVFHQSI